ncbi:hydrogen gas-evolving membrane-bound hydrogenase subunit E [Jhaorihella thermophila]
MEIAIIPLLGWIGVILATALVVIFHRNRLVTLVLIGVVGLVVSLAFTYLSAPDLALTQISVEVVTVVLMLLALNFLPRETPLESSPMRRMRDAALSIAAGLGVGGLIYALMVRDFAFPTISDYHLANSYSGGGGTNVVNVILVDFRGYDTFGEITVLGIAAIVIFAVTRAVLNSPVRAYLLNRKPSEPQSGDAHPMIMVVATRMMMPVALMVATYIFLRGHNLPGGGFIAGLIAAIALVMQYMASGFFLGGRAAAVPLFGADRVGGVLVAAATGIGSWLAGKPFLTSAFGYFHFPPLEKFELATAMLFDLGVFLAVVGAVLLALESLARFAWRPGIASEFPMDINPAREVEETTAEEAR